MKVSTERPVDIRADVEQRSSQQMVEAGDQAGLCAGHKHPQNTDGQQEVVPPEGGQQTHHHPEAVQRTQHAVPEQDVEGVRLDAGQHGDQDRAEFTVRRRHLVPRDDVTHEVFDEVLQSLRHQLQERPHPLYHHLPDTPPALFHQHWHFVVSSSLLLILTDSVIVILDDYMMMILWCCSQYGLLGTDWEVRDQYSYVSLLPMLVRWY